MYSSLQKKRSKRRNHSTPPSSHISQHICYPPTVHSRRKSLSVISNIPNPANIIQVAIRCRPLIMKEKNNCIYYPNKNQIMVETQRINKLFNFEYVFTQNEDQEYIYKKCVQDLITQAFLWYHVSIFAYGQTSSGKTYTLYGNLSDSSCSSYGIVSRALHQIFQYVSTSSNIQHTDSYSITLSFMELYNENIRDLFMKIQNPSGNPNPNHSSLKVHEKPGDEFYVKNLTRIVVPNVEYSEEIIKKALQFREVDRTRLNEHSSRSHAILTIYLERSRILQHRTDITNEVKEEKICKITFIDLAGSERLSVHDDVSNNPLRKQSETICINKSLSALGNVISALAENAPYIPYRANPLTKLLRTSLGGSAKTLMISMISPAESNGDETLSTLLYASRARRILNIPKINEDPKDTMINELRKQIELFSQYLTKNIHLASNLPKEIRSILPNSSSLSLSFKYCESSESCPDSHPIGTRAYLMQEGYLHDKINTPIDGIIETENESFNGMWLFSPLSLTDPRLLVHIDNAQLNNLLQLNIQNYFQKHQQNHICSCKKNFNDRNDATSSSNSSHSRNCSCRSNHSSLNNFISILQNCIQEFETENGKTIMNRSRSNSFPASSSNFNLIDDNSYLSNNIPDNNTKESRAVPWSVDKSRSIHLVDIQEPEDENNDYNDTSQHLPLNTNDHNTSFWNFLRPKSNNINKNHDNSIDTSAVELVKATRIVLEKTYLSQVKNISDELKKTKSLLIKSEAESNSLRQQINRFNRSYSHKSTEDYRNAYSVFSAVIKEEIKDFWREGPRYASNNMQIFCNMLKQERDLKSNQVNYAVSRAMHQLEDYRRDNNAIKDHCLILTRKLESLNVNHEQLKTEYHEARKQWNENLHHSSHPSITQSQSFTCISCDQKNEFLSKIDSLTEENKRLHKEMQMIAEHYEQEMIRVENKIKYANLKENQTPQQLFQVKQALEESDSSSGSLNSTSQK